MSWRKTIRLAFREFFDRKRLDQETEEELKFHLEAQTEEYKSSGSTPEEAKRRAILDLGGYQQVKEQIREQRRGYFLQTVWKDAAYGFRLLLRTPGFTIATLLTLALGIGGSTAMFSVIQAVLLNPLPYEHPEQLVQIWDTNPSAGIDQIGTARGNIKDWKERSTLFESIAGYYTMGRTLTNGSDSSVLLSAQVTDGFFEVLKTRPMRGRAFIQEEIRRAVFNTAAAPIGPDPVAIISHRLWVSSFGGDPQIIGRKFQLERRSFRIVGVMPADFAFPAPDVDLWIPWSLTPPVRNPPGKLPRDQHYVKSIARMKAGVTRGEAESHLNAIAGQLATEFPETNKGWEVSLIPLKEQITGSTGSVLWILFAAVGTVLVLACMNVSLLQLARATARKQEAAVRLALGASRGRLVRQLLVESLVLAVCGGILGIGVAFGAVQSLKIWQPDLPRVLEVFVNGRALLFSAGLAFLSAVIFGLVPAWTSARADAAQVFREGRERSTPSRSGEAIRDLLVIGEVAMTMILLAGAGLLLRSFLMLQSVHPGFDAKNVLVLPIFLDSEKYDSGEKSRGYYQKLFEHLARLPGVTSVGGATALPASPLGPDFERPVWAPERPAEAAYANQADVRMVTPDYFRTMGMTVLKGRAFTNGDSPDSTRVVIVNRHLAQKIWPGENPVGKYLTVDYSSSGTYSYEVVGVVNNVRFRGPRAEPRSEIFFPHAQRSYLILNVALRTSVDPRLLIPAVRQTLLEIDPQKPAHNITPLEDLVAATVTRDRYATLVVGFFALVSILLSMLGIYGLLTYRVRQKLQEIGIRMALGAEKLQILRWIAIQGIRLILAGATAGLLCALLSSRLLSGLLFEIRPNDPYTLVSMFTLLLLMTLAACSIPAWRASRVDPGKLLRYPG